MKTTFEHVRLPFATIEALRLLTSLALLRPDAFRYGVLKDNKILGVMLYGPPGTGKTHLAKAVAKESGATMLEISGADVLARYVGDGEKTVRAVFTLARKLDPCIIFFDEADAVFRGRSDDENGYHRELLNQFLHEWDGIANGKENSAFMMVATNRPYDLDEAVLRRLPRRILVDIPTYEDREAILKIYLADEKLGDDVDLKKLATSTPNYTGSDLKNLCVAAAFQSVYEETNAAGNGILGNFATKGRIATALAKQKWPERRVLCGRHFDKARDEISSTIDTGSIEKIREFHRSRRVLQPERRVELPPPTRSRQQIKPKSAAAAA
jgi:SpoVK/Ycf46/Vps4 family AAA+-type ATPase